MVLVLACTRVCVCVGHNIIRIIARTALKFRNLLKQSAVAVPFTFWADN